MSLGFPQEVVVSRGSFQEDSFLSSSSFVAGFHRCVNTMMGMYISSYYQLSGVWSNVTRLFHINILELMAVYLALKNLPVPMRVHIRIRSDNSMAVNYLSHLRSARTRPLNNWILSVLHSVRRRKIFFSPCHTASLKIILYHPLCLGESQVNLFATLENHQLPTYISPVLDLSAFMTDVFQVDWN